jgi:hypothetical protein
MTDDNIHIRKISDDIVNKYCLINPKYRNNQLYDDACIQLNIIVNFLANNDMSYYDEKGDIRDEYVEFVDKYTYIVYGMTKDKLDEIFVDQVRNLNDNIFNEIENRIII